ncbi:hypothetical protein LC092_19295 [Stappia stellulata]|uniref:hypothetical protein n=1 Tax=Stappia stellulata TaxID=71235 RepID=UPI001CD6C625|nr:hypothetical protein [Stappia stellulata]MCA1244597.1 hypothetical protein [Stappia stellulata]
MTRITHGTFPIAKPPHLETRADATPPLLPAAWECTALLHAYSPPPRNDPKTTPFYQMCLAFIGYVAGETMSIRVVGLDYGTWWYVITPSGTKVSTDKGLTFTDVDMGWTLPTQTWLPSTASYFQTGYLNWMEAQEVDWWKQPVENSNAATWTWFDSATSLPFRMMFGAPPPSPTMGDPAQLAFFQNFSFTYFPTFEATASPNVSTWVTPVIEGFQPGNPNNLKLVVWNDCFYMTTFMTPVDSASLPLPTVVLYQWKPDADYRVVTDRAQATIMSYEYNPSAGFQDQVALLYGVAPTGTTPPPWAGNGFIYNEIYFLTRGYPTPVVLSCDNIGLGQQPPDWARIPAVEGKIHATVTDNSALSPGQATNIISVLFPPTREYPQGRYLWTWYSLLPGSDGTNARPVTFMESASNIAEGGTSLALADYYDYVESPSWFPAEYYALPELCTVSGAGGKATDKPTGAALHHTAPAPKA